MISKQYCFGNSSNPITSEESSSVLFALWWPAPAASSSSHIASTIVDS
jgi:hypothetical protein